MTWFLDSAALSAGLGLGAGLGVPALIARIPEPVGDAAEIDEADSAAPPLAPGAPEPDLVVEAPKELYVSIAAAPRLPLGAALATAVVAGLVGGRLGWSWALLFLLPLVPVGVALAVVDWRTRLLPTKVIAPTYVALVALVLLAGLASGDWGDVRRAGWGWVVGGGTFLVLWLVYPRGMGYGDVRLSGVLGIALGYVGWGTLLVGIYAGFLLGGLGGTLLTLLRLVDRKAYPFGPFMLLGALVGVLLGPWFAGLYET